MAEDEVVGWHHQLDGHEFEQFWELVMDWEAWHVGAYMGGQRHFLPTIYGVHFPCFPVPLQIGGLV